MSYNTFQQENGDGSRTVFTTSFDPQIKTTDVKVYILDSDGVYQPQTTGFTVSGNDITFDTAPATGTGNILITRETDVSDNTIPQFNPGSSIRGQDLDSNFQQLLYSAQETSDKSIDKTRPELLSSLDMNAKKITNLGEATDDNDAVTREQLGDLIVEDMTGDTTTGLVFTKTTGGTNSGDQLSVAINRLTLAEQNANPNDAGTDDKLASMAALTKRFDVIYQSGTPSGTDWPDGKLWYDHGNDQTLSVWSTANQNWLGVVSGGTFITQPTVIWVDQANGLDTNDGHRVIDAMKTIKAAVASADDGDIILIAPGVYREVAPIDITVNNLSVVGQSLRSVFVHPTPATEENTLFRVNSGTLLSNMTFAGLKASGTRGGLTNTDPDSEYGLPENQGWVAEFYPNAVIYKSPYIQNCTNFADSSISNATQSENPSNYFNPNNVTQGGFGGDLTSGPTGGGIFVDGFAVSSSSPLRSMVVDSFTQITLDGPGILATNNAYAQLVSFFGTFCHYHAKALNGAQLNLSNCTTDYGRYGLIADGISPTANFQASVGANASIGATTITIGQPSAGPNWYGSATRPQDNMVVEIGSNTYPIRSAVANGNGWDVTIERPDPNANATNLGLAAAITTSDTAYFYNRSYISTGGHTFEYVGSGTDYRAAPENGGVPIEANQVVNLRNGKVWQSSTDHNGKFKVGETFSVNQRTGEVFISLDAYRPEVGNDLTPELGGDLDVVTYDIVSSSNRDIDIMPDGTGSVNLGSSASVVASSGNFNTSGSISTTGGLTATGSISLGGIVWPSSDGGQNHVITTNGSGTLSFQAVSALQGSGILNVVDDTTPQLGGDLDVNGKNITGTVRLNSLTYPSSDGSANQVLTTDGSGNLSFSTVSSSSGGISNVVEDTTPQLGGNLDLNSYNITGTGSNITISNTVTAANFVKSGGTSSQFLKADGSVDSSTYITSYTETDPVVAAINGIVKSNGSTISAATAGTDYLAPTGDGSSLTGVLSDVVEDTSPQLGGNLDVNGNDIVTTSNGDIDLDPNGTGVVVFKGNSNKGSGQFKLNCENNSHAITIKGPPHSASASYTLTLPNNDGNADQVLKTDGSGNLAWVDQISSSGSGDIPSGTKMIFYESSAPSGWTQYTNLNDYGLRVVSGSGGGTTGSVNFGDLFDEQTINVTSNGSVSSETAGGSVSANVHGHNLTTSEMPQHRHAYTKVSNSNAQDNRGGPNNGQFTFNQYTTTAYTTYEGSGSPHDHGISANFYGAAHSHGISNLSGSGTLDMRLKYADVIICTKN